MNEMKQSGVSLYHIIEESLRNSINSGEWKKGTRIPSETVLADQFAVSRSTIRQAIANLVSDGLLIRRQGLGTFVASPIYQGDYLKFFFPEELGGRHKLISYQLEKGSHSVTSKLCMEDGSTITELIRLRFFGDDIVPAVLEKSYFRPELFMLIQNSDLSQKLYGIIEKSLGTRLTHFNNMIEPVIPTLEETKLLQLSVSSPVLLISRTCYDEKGEPLILTKSLIRADKCKLLVIS